MGCTAACQGEYGHPRERRKLLYLGLPVAPARIATMGQGLLPVFLLKNSLHVLHQKPAAGWCRQVPSQVFAAGAVHASVSTLLHSVRLWGHTGLISNCKEVNVAHRESGIKISKAGAFWGLSGAWCCSCCTGDVNWG